MRVGFWPIARAFSHAEDKTGGASELVNAMLRLGRLADVERATVVLFTVDSVAFIIASSIQVEHVYQG